MRRIINYKYDLIYFHNNTKFGQRDEKSFDRNRNSKKSFGRRDVVRNWKTRWIRKNNRGLSEYVDTIQGIICYIIIQIFKIKASMKLY